MFEIASAGTIDLVPKKVAKNREEWLDSAVALLRPLMEEHDCPEFVDPLVSVGWAKGARGGSKGFKTIGQCWNKSQSGDKERSHIFISPELELPFEVLHTLLHEMVHASVGTSCGHRGPFRKLAVAVGLTGKMTATIPGKDLTETLHKMLEGMDEFPHPGLNGDTGGKKGSRLLKVWCRSCGCITRMTRMWLEHPGPPICGCGSPMEED